MLGMKETLNNTFFIEQGASSHWWNFRHSLHHSKPNIIKKDPDVNVAYLFLLGEKLPKIWGEKKRGKMPHQYQHIYFFFCEYCPDMTEILLKMR